MTLVLSGTAGVSSVSGSAATPALQGDSPTTGMFFPATNTIALSTAATERARVDSAGLVGINTTTPTERLDVNGGIRSTGGSNDFNTTGAFMDYSNGFMRFNVYRSTGSNIIFLNNASGGTVTEKMRLDTGGNFLVGRSSRLNVGRVEVLAATTEQAIVAQVQTNANSIFQGFNSSGSATFYVVGTGNIYSTSTTITAISDVRQKENIRPIPYGLNTICALKPVKFDFRQGCASEEKDLLGFIAQDVEPIIPEIVKPFGADGLKGLKAGDILPVLVKAVQELKSVVDAQAAEIDSIKRSQP